MPRHYQTMQREQLELLVETSAPSNDARSGGYALVNVLGREQFDEEHIPGSINIPHGEAAEFERRFDKQKQIVVYCASPSCSASRDAARSLAERGFQNVHAYAGGMSEWKEAGNPTAGTKSASA